jgi:hypothetical protein
VALSRADLTLLRLAQSITPEKDRPARNNLMTANEITSFHEE